jgi:signal transduction histidine kinase
MYFGTGLSAVVDDLGSQGEPPSHPELLDWLATEFTRLGWSRKALIRLLANACRFSSSTTPISIRSRIDTADDSDHLVLTIADRGVGISRAHQHRAFEPFWRGPQTGETPGQGMGLPIARRLIEAQGGWIELRSALGVGTEVEVWLPPELSADRPA